MARVLTMIPIRREVNLMGVIAGVIVALAVGIVLGRVTLNTASVDTSVVPAGSTSIAEPAVISEPSVAQDVVTLMTADPYYTASTATTTDIQAYDAQGRVFYHYRGAEVMTDPYQTTVAQMTADPYYSASTAQTTDIQAHDNQGRVFYVSTQVMTDPYQTTVAQMTADPYYSASP